MEKEVVGVVLAGGKSTRAKKNKLLLEVDRKPLISHTIDTISPFVDKVIVVTGKYHDDLCRVITNAEIVFNSNYEKGMFSSVLAGAKAAKGNDVILIPGDITNVSASTMRAILAGSKQIRVPSFKGKTGHPVFISRSYIDLLLEESTDSNLRDFISKYNQNVEIIDVNDSFINFDVDTLEDYDKLRKEFTL